VGRTLLSDFAEGKLCPTPLTFAGITTDKGAPSFAFFEDSLSKNTGFFSGEVQENLSFKRPRPLPGV
jgi:hypothetical protein